MMGGWVTTILYLGYGQACSFPYPPTFEGGLQPLSRLRV
jgi:hypothetical protein